MVDMSVALGSIVLNNPVMPASGTFAEGLAGIVDFGRLGAMVTKTITAGPRAGNPVPRVSEIDGGMLNSIGIPSKGVEGFLRDTLPFYRQFDTPLVVSISASTVEGFASLATQLELPGIAAIEANISCPNIEEDGRAFAISPLSTGRVIERMRAATRMPIWAKLTPNTGEIGAVARAAETAGADALVVANTILAMSIDIETRRPSLGNVMGGLSGPAIKPIIVRMTYQCAKAVRIPIIGCGGIADAEDALEYLLAGASAVQVGTATFLRPRTMLEVIDGIRGYCQRNNIESLSGLVGAVNDRELVADPMEAVL